MRIAKIAVTMLCFTTTSIGLAKAVVPESPQLENAISSQLDLVRKLSEGKDYKATLSATDLIAPYLEGRSAEAGEVEAIRADALHGLHRDAEAILAAAKAIVLLPDRLGPLTFFIVDRQSDAGHIADAAATLIQLARRDPEAARSVNSSFLSGLAQRLEDGGNRKIERQLAAAFLWIDFRGENRFLGLPWLQLDGMIGLAEAGHLDEARAMLASVPDTEVIVRIAIDRRFEAIWRDIDAALGPGLAKANNSYVKAARRDLDDDPDNEVKRHAYLVTLLQTGRAREASVFGSAFFNDPSALEGITASGIDFVDTHAYALADAGQIDAALARYRSVNALELSNHPQIVETLIGAAQLEVTVGRYQQAMDSIERFERLPGEQDSFGTGWSLEVRACALHRLGRQMDADAAMDRLAARPNENRSAFLDGLLCLGRFEQAEQVVLARLGDESRRADMMYRLQPLPFAVFAGRRDKAMSAATAVLAARPKVAAAINLYGRLLPLPLRQKD